MNICPICGGPATRTFCSLACRYADMRTHPMRPSAEAIERGAAKKRGRPQSADHRAKNAAANRGRWVGPDNPAWKGGEYRHEGYVFVRVALGKYRKRSHLVWEAAHPGESIEPGAVIHHVNHIKDDDRADNLVKLTRGSHMHAHDFGHNAGVNRGWREPVKWSPERRAEFSARMKQIRAEKFWTSRPKHQ